MICKWERALGSRLVLPPVKMYVATTVPDEEAAELQELVLDPGGVLVSAVDVAAYTVYPDPRGGSRRRRTHRYWCVF